MHNPVATYRLQFHKEFTFDVFEKIIPYLRKLGVSTIYASPVFQATPGSTHGYDALNPNKINPEIGSKNQLINLARNLEEEGISWLQDIVPNHMAFDTRNLWLRDVLEKGQLSIYAPFFDVPWTGKIYHGRMMVPFLGASLDEVIKNKELKVDFDNKRLVFRYYESTYPLHIRSYSTILKSGKEEPSKAIKQLLTQIEEIHILEEQELYGQRWNEFGQQFISLMKDEASKDFILSCMEEVNNDAEIIKKISGEQVYQLCEWQKTDYRINFRRFFTVNGLICLNIQNSDVFQLHHELIKEMVDEGIFKGLRIDHIDGLYDPNKYLDDLRNLAGGETYIIVEKILEPGEALPKKWPIQGNTGYDFLGIVNNLFTNKENEEKFNELYQQITNDYTPIQQQLREKKSHILYDSMGGELQNLYQLFLDLNLIDKRSFARVRKEDMKSAIAEFLIHCPVYRYYGNRMPLDGEEAAAIQDIFNRVRRTDNDLSDAVSLLEIALLKNPREGNQERNAKALRFYQRCMQFTGPLMAKGVEDTLMYTYNRFIGHNEVGDSPEAFGLLPHEFHHAMRERQQHWPFSLNATSTHDTKRGEDVRARLNVLTDLADEWTSIVAEWQDMNNDLKQDQYPDSNDEYFIYQTLAGAFPMAGQDEDNFSERMQQYIEKALREAKTYSNWTTPDEEYESAAKQFAVQLLDKTRPFWKSFETFHQKISDYGVVNSLSQVLLKFACPGVPDVYQGCELWDFSLVDPDNRRPVDYQKRQEWLEELEPRVKGKEGQLLQELWNDRYNAKIKLWLVHTLFDLRKQYPTVFSEGEYIPLQVEGQYKDNILAFARKQHRHVFIVAVPLHIAAICEEQSKGVDEVDWKDTRILLPKDVVGDWEHQLAYTQGGKQSEIEVKDIFNPLPFAILKVQQTVNQRGAGILMHITSLPSPFGVGDMGPEAFSFADFLSRTNQRFWQLLPLNPTEEGQGHSPYSSISSRAGNPLLISPEHLAKEGLLNHTDLHQFILQPAAVADYPGAEKVKLELFELAYNNYRQQRPKHLELQLEEFCNKEADWLEDFALYMVLKKEQGGKAWFQWPEEYKQRDKAALEKLRDYHYYEVSKIKWLQFIFHKQWKELRSYCNTRNIQLFGDVPFYISYDSVDVWSHREIFSIDKEGNMIGVAGVPPDAFSDDGQLWGMPVFKWDVLKKRNYDWWLGRFRKNMELFDLVRLDHFRAFADYWEVPASEKTAKNGIWKRGPREDFFKVVKKELKDLPFIAEDLGEINQPVYDLRDAFGFPGMKILQFAFSEDLPQSPHIPHNYTENFIAYTGTHDNNTIRGWYRQEGKDSRQRVEQYVGRTVHEEDAFWVLGHMAYASVAKTAILPLQDVLNLDEKSRMNIPASGEKNWAWRLLPGQIRGGHENTLREWTWMFNRE
ncbi:MAG: 4-alpha-glucanotransferase [Segetibacter sp.]|nr:4-alpha-glucanotransferase [Segetibacter sp.]